MQDFFPYMLDLTEYLQLHESRSALKILKFTKLTQNSWTNSK